MNPFRNGMVYQQQVCDRLNMMFIRDARYTVRVVRGAEAGPDVIIECKPEIGVEAKNRGAFEGGSKKMVYDQDEKRLIFPEGSLHACVLGDRVIYEGMNLPWYEGKRKLVDYANVRNVFDKEVHIDVAHNTVADYYKSTGVHYMSLEGYGLYHTGTDPLGLDVPYFQCKQILRIRTTKHSRNGIHTDVVGDFNYDKKSLVKSPYDLFQNLPPPMKLQEE
jgi:hypothetical protein